MNFKRYGLVLLSLFVVFACASAQLKEKRKKAKNVILLISDGAGLSQVSSAFYFKKSKPNYARFETIGLIKTSSSKQDVTDSAAGATAFACGEKTYNGAIGVGKDSTVIKNLVEIVSEKHIKTGIIATSSITHATPASFYSHVLSRQMNEEIAADLLKSNVDFFAAGGKDFFDKRRDSLNLLKDFTNRNYHINTTTLENFKTIKSKNKVGYLLAPNAMPKMVEGRGDFLSNATDLAIAFLSKDNNGFFIMSEGSQIDWGGHQNDGTYLVSELIDFDEAIGKALDFAVRDGNTLVLVTADHETGGFTLSGKQKERADGSIHNDYSEVGMSFSNGGHSATLIPVFAFGPGSEEFRGIYENNDIFHKILKVTDWNLKD